MRKNRLLKGILLTLVLSMLVTGCGKEDTTSNDNRTSQNVEQEEQESVDSDGEQSDALETDEAGIGAIEILPISTMRNYRSVTDDNSEEYKELISIQVDGALLYSEDGYADLAKALQKNAEEAYQASETFEKETKAVLEEYGLPFDDMVAEYEDNVKMKRADSSIVSFLRQCYTYEGGAHPNMYARGFNYDAKSGALLSLSDVVADVEKVKEIVIEQLDGMEYKDGYFDDWKETVEKSFEPDYTNYDFAWVMTSSGLLYICNTYAIGPYAMGPVQVELSYADYPELFVKDYALSERGFVHDMSEYGEYNREYQLDVDEDGNDEYLQILVETRSGEYEDNGEIVTYEDGEDIVISYGKDAKGEQNVAVELEAECSYESAYVMKNASGKSFLYVQTSGFNDYEMVDVYDLSSPEKGAVHVGTADGAFGEVGPQDSQHFYMFTRIQCMGTYSGYRECYIGEDGLPVPYDEAYTVIITNYDNVWDSSLPTPAQARFENDMGKITLKQEVSVRCYNALELRDMDAYSTIPAGTVISPYRTDNETYMTFILEDGRFIDLEYDGTDENGWKTIQGLTEEELLDGVMYAG